MSRLALSFLILHSVSAIAYADGGTVCTSERIGPYQVTVFTSPTPLRAGPVDISVLVQDVKTGAVVEDAPISIRVSHGAAQARILYPSRQAANNQLYQAAQVELTPGTWSIDVLVAGERSGAGCIMYVADPLPRWIEMGFWLALPVVPIVLFILGHRAERKRAAAQR
jgi:hypothetical protein